MTNPKQIKGVEIPNFPNTTPNTPETITEIMESIKNLNRDGIMIAYNDDFNIELFRDGDENMIRVFPTIENSLRTVYDANPMIKSFAGVFFVPECVTGWDLLEKCMVHTVKLHCELRKKA